MAPGEVDDGLFDDVRDPKHPYFKAIYWAADNGITKGYTGTNLFGIDDPCTRGQAMIFLWRMAGKPNPKYQSKSPFKDAITPAYKTAVLWAVEKKVTNGFSDGTFRDKAACTRGMIVKFLYNIR